jgi:predicted SAM-dependent methyltransferase
MLKLNLGCWTRDFGPDWVHIDGGDLPHLDSHDIVNLPYEDNSVDLIYASHVFEYFDREEGLEVLKKWFAKLKPGSTLRIAVPDFEAMAKLYVAGKYPLKNFLGPMFGKMKMGNETIYHKTVYDFQGLSELLMYAGFSDIKLYDWRQTEHAQFDDHSQSYLPHMDKENGTLMSLNIECIKR